MTLVLCMCIGTAFADQTITVTGTGEVLIPADTAIVSIGVSVRDKEVLKAQERVNIAIEAIRNALIENNVRQENINTDYVNIYAYYNYEKDSETVEAYNASSTLAVKVTDVKQVGRIIDIAFQNGANTLDGISFFAENDEEAKNEAMKLAVKNAREKAEVLAEAAGVTLNGIEEIAEGNTYSFDRGVVNNFGMVKAAGVTNDSVETYVQSAKLTVSSQVTIIYNFSD